MTNTLTFTPGQLNFGTWPSPSTAPTLTLPRLVPETGSVTFAALGAHPSPSTSTPDEVADEWAAWEERFMSLLPVALVHRHTLLDAAGAIAGWVDAAPPVTWISLGEDETWRLEVASPAGWARGFLATQIRSKLPRSTASRGTSATVSYFMTSASPAMSCWSFGTEPSNAEGIIIEDVLNEGAGAVEDILDEDVVVEVAPEHLEAMDAAVEGFKARRAQARAEERRLAKYDRG